MDKFLSCNGFGISPFSFIKSYLNSSRGPKPEPQRNESIMIYTYQCRNAIALFCKFLKISSNDEVLVPAYNCGAEIDPYMKSGAKVILYRIDEHLKICLDDIKQRITPKTKIIHVTHFFGLPQNITELVSVCQEKKIILLEDCAQSLYHSYTLAETGAGAAVYSFVKFLPVPDGGALVMNKIHLEGEIPSQQPDILSTVKNSVPLFKKWFMNTNRLWQKCSFTRNIFCKSWKFHPEKKSSVRHPAMLSSNYFIPENIYLSVSKITSGFLKRLDKDEVIRIRRRNYMFLHDNFPDIQEIRKVFHSLPESVCPMSFPVMVNKRKIWYEYLDNAGIQVQGWPGYYPGFPWDDYPEACNLKDNLLTLPVHQYLGIDQMEYIINTIKSCKRDLYS